jgi:hypothetical protein
VTLNGLMISWGKHWVWKEKRKMEFKGLKKTLGDEERLLYPLTMNSCLYINVKTYQIIDFTFWNLLHITCNSETGINF